MSDISGTWVGITLGVIIVLVALLWNRFLNKDTQVIEEFQTAEQATEGLVRESHIQEKIRQIALIEKDEFDQFYRPLIEMVSLYLTIINRNITDQHYFEMVYKALRKRRSAIFECGSSERDQQNKALWTFALFCAISIRFVVKQYQCHQFKVHDRLINPYLVPARVLANSEIEKLETLSRLESGTVQIHLIDKLLTADIIARFENAGIYGFIINAVSGFYHERLNPFYSIIEEVEAHMAGIEASETEVFEQNVKAVLSLIEENTFSKNTRHSFVFEGMSHLLIDRNFLWELFRGYSVYESKPLGKKDFEERLTRILNLGKSLEKNTIFTFTLDDAKLDDSQADLILELRNMVALPYKAVPYYRFADRKKIKKHVLQRDIAAGDVSGVPVEEQDVDKSLSVNESRSRANHFPEGPPDSVGLKDLFSESS